MRHNEHGASNHGASTMPKRDRTRAAKAVLWLDLAATAQRWADEIAGDEYPTMKPFAEWGDDDPFVTLARELALTSADLVRILSSMADQLETRSLALGGGDAIFPDGSGMEVLWIEVL